MRDEILVRLSRADAEQSRETVAFLATLGAKYQQEDQVRPLLDALDAALAAPAEGPERAATGETGYYVGVDVFGQKVRVANNVHFTDGTKRKRAASGGGGEGGA